MARAQSESVPDALAHFRQLPWCAELLDAPDAIPFLHMSRLENENAGKPGYLTTVSQDQLMHDSLNTANTVPWTLCYFSDPAKQPPRDPNLPPTLSIPTAHLLLDIQSGVNGFTGFCHGGFTVIMIDEAMGGLLFCNNAYQNKQETLAAKEGKKWTPRPGFMAMPKDARVFTAGMNVRLQRPIPTPSVVRTTATITKVEGRKIYLQVNVYDSKGRSCASCEGMWMWTQPGSKI